MKARFNRERIGWKIRSSAKSQEGYSLSGVARVHDQHGIGYCNIHFDPSFVKAIGKVMPAGIGPENEAFIYVSRLSFNGTIRWSVYARYLEATTGVFLWRQHEKPPWVDNVQRGR